MNLPPCEMNMLPRHSVRVRRERHTLLTQTRLWAAFWLFVCSPFVHAAPLMLVTENEMRASQAATTPEASGPIARGLSAGGTPRIEVLVPDTRASVNVPTRIQVRFFAEPPAEAKPESFKVLYGALRLDITSRLLNVAPITRLGLDVPEVSLPQGRHQLQLILSDTLGRETRQMVVFTVQ